MANKITVEQIKDEIHKMDENLSEDDDSFVIAVLLISACQVGTTIKALSKFTNYPVCMIRSYIQRARKKGIFKNGKIIHSGWFNEDTGSICFWLDVAVVHGYLDRK